MNQRLAVDLGFEALEAAVDIRQSDPDLGGKLIKVLSLCLRHGDHTCHLLSGLPIHVSALERHDVIDRASALLIGFDNNGRHARLHFVGH
jgi:hypothetical protein